MTCFCPIRGATAQKLCRRVLLQSGECWRPLSSQSQTRADKRQMIREQLRKEIGQGYIAELKEFRLNGAKRSEAPTNICKQKDGVQFPTFDCVTLSQQQIKLPGEFIHKTTLVLLSMRGVGLDMCDMYRKSFEEEFQVPWSHLSLLEICLVDNWLFKLVRNLLEGQLRKKLKPPSRHDQFVCQMVNARTIKATLSVHNSLIGYAFLVDQNGLVRWSAHGKPTERELRSLTYCTNKLMEESRHSTTKDADEQ